jgi:hypothetical protein
MDAQEIAHLRLAYQRITRPTFTQPDEAAAWFGAVQGQEYGAGKWAMGLRMASGSDADIEKAIAERKIVRSWVLRGTLHFAAAEDMRWLLELVRPANARRYSSYNRRLELDEEIFARSREVFTEALQGGQALTRTELADTFKRQGIATHDLRLSFILYAAALHGLICFGQHRGKQPTFVLLEEWAPPAAAKSHEEALAELAWRFFRSHGPATLKDFGWWSGLPAGEARAGLELVKARLAQESSAGQVYWLDPERPEVHRAAPSVDLLPIYDEYLVGYSERSAVMDAQEVMQQVGERGSLGPFMVIDGQVAGSWKRTFQKDGVAVALNPFRPLSAGEEQGAAAAVNRYAAFLGMRLK